MPLFVCEYKRWEMPTSKDVYMHLETFIQLYQNRVSQENLGCFKVTISFKESEIQQPERTTVCDQRHVM